MRASRGPLSEDDFRALYEATARRISSYLRRVLGSPSDAEDLLQETYFRYIRSPLASDNAEEIRAYLFTIASRLVIDHWRQKRRRPQAVMSAPEPQVRTDPGLTRDIERALATLKPQERALLWLAYVEGSNHRDIASALGVKFESVKVLLFRARRRFAQLLDPQEPAGVT